MASSPAADTVQIRCPLPRSSQAGVSSRAARTWAITLTCHESSQADSGASGPPLRAMPALAQYRSISPSSARAAAMSAATPSSLAASPGTATPPQDVRPRPRPPAALMSLTTTRAPSAANRRASAAPMPLPPPVTTTPAPATVRIARPLSSSAGRQPGQLRQRGPVRVGGAEADRVGLGPLEEQVRRVLPGEPDAAVQLDRLLRGLHRRVGAGRLRQGDGQLRLGDQILGHRPVVALPGCGHRGQGVGGRPGSGPRLGDRDPQVGQPVLDRLEAADRAGELVPFLDVGDRHLQASVGQAELLGGEDPGARRAARRSPPAAQRRRPRPGAPTTPSRCRSHSCRVMSSDTTGALPRPGSLALTAYSPNGTPSAGTSSTSAGSASATPATVPLSR